MLLCALASGRPAFANEVTFAQARAAAQRVAPDVVIAEHRSSVANTEVEVVGALANPTFTVSAARESAWLSTGVSVPLSLFGQRATAMRAADADARAVALEVEVSRSEAIWAATVAWFDLENAQERARLLALAAQDSDRLFHIASEKFEAGTGARLDVVRTQADRLRELADAHAAQLAVKAAQARLAPWIDSALDVELLAVGEPDYLLELVPMETIEKEISAHPALRRDRAQIQAAAAHVASEQRARWPLISPEVTVSQGDPALAGTDVTAGLSFELPLLSLHGGAIAKADEQRNLAEAENDGDQRRLHAELVDAYRRTEGASAMLRTLRTDVLPAMEEAKAMTEEGYKSGRIDLIRVMEAQRALLDSRISATEAFGAWGHAAADLEKASGVDLTRGANHAP